MKIFQNSQWNPNFGLVSSLFFPIMPYAKLFAKLPIWPSLNQLNLFRPPAVHSFTSQEITFVPHMGRRQKSKFECLYEPRIFLKGEVSTREKNWHDFFNSQIWYSFPKTKRALNMRHFTAFEERADFPWLHSVETRTTEQDKLTMFDEGGCILVRVMSSAKKNEGLIPFLFGHGFYERILYGDRDLSACALTIDTSEDTFSHNWFDTLSSIDSQVSSLILQRSTFERKGVFSSISLSEMMDMLNLSKSIMRTRAFLQAYE